MRMLLADLRMWLPVQILVLGSGKPQLPDDKAMTSDGILCLFLEKSAMISCPVPQSASLPVPIVRARPNYPLDIVITAREFKATVACTMEASCCCCLDNSIRRWQGYVTCESRKSGNPGLLQFTPTVGKKLESWYRGEDGILGLKCRIERAGTKVNSPLSVAFQGWQDDTAECSESRLLSLVQALFPPQEITNIKTA